MRQADDADMAVTPMSDLPRMDTTPRSSVVSELQGMAFVPLPKEEQGVVDTDTFEPENQQEAPQTATGRVGVVLIIREAGMSLPVLISAQPSNECRS